jgi:hypothetical protein
MPKKTTKPEPKPGPTPKPNGLVIRASPEWRERLKDAAKRDRRAMAEFIDEAVRLYARTLGDVGDWPDR